MAEEAEEQAENALNIIVNTVEQSSNMRKTLKQRIFETVSTLRTIIAKLKDSGNRKIREIQKLTKQVEEMGTELKQCRDKLDNVHSVPSLDEVEEQVRNKGKIEARPSTGITTKSTGGPTGYVAPHNGTSTEPRGEPTSYTGLPKGYTKMIYAEGTQGI
jgi:chromosome segregation ATPase